MRSISAIRQRVVSQTEELGSMFLIRRASVILAGAVLISSLASGSLWAAKGSSKVYVPAKIIKGSSVTKGRAFYKTGVPEDSLAGIRLGRPAREILGKWGNPSRVTVGSPQTDQNATPEGGPAYTSAMPVAGGTYNPYASAASGVNMAASMVGLQNPIMGTTSGGLPALPGMTMPGEGAPTQSQSTGGSSAALSEEEVTWTYDLQNGITLEFIITDGLVTQITVGGAGPWGLSKTKSGLQLGDTYKLALWVCGYPENQKYVGRFLRASYVNKNRALYTFLKNKLVGVTIAMVPNDITLK
ncbi:hypothetical protein LLG46_08090 [bacterium]|nr:hypothetical protein [bacterium]